MKKYFFFNHDSAFLFDDIIIEDRNKYKHWLVY